MKRIVIGLALVGAAVALRQRLGSTVKAKLAACAAMCSGRCHGQGVASVTAASGGGVTACGHVASRPEE